MIWLLTSYFKFLKFSHVYFLVSFFVHEFIRNFALSLITVKFEILTTATVHGAMCVMVANLTAIGQTVTKIWAVLLSKVRNQFLCVNFMYAYTP